MPASSGATGTVSQAPLPKLAVLVIGEGQTALRTFLARYVKPAFGMKKPQWRARYREHYGLTVLSQPLLAGQDPAEVYAAHAGAGALVVACLPESNPRSGLAATQAWLEAQGFNPVQRMPITMGGAEFEAIEQGADIVNFINRHCPWRSDPIEDIEAYMAAHPSPFWG